MKFKGLIKKDRKFKLMNGIYFFQEPHDNYWDSVYSKGVKGNFQKSEKDLIQFVRFALHNKKACENYFPIIKLFNQKVKSAIEIGSGTGTFSLVLKKMGLVDKVFLVEKSKKALYTSKKMFEYFNEEATYIYADALDLPFRKNIFDVSISGGMIEHFKGDELKKIILEQYRVARYPIFQFPTTSMMYWLQRGIITLVNGKWPFGYEVPLSKNKFISFLPKDSHFNKNYHDFLTAFLFRLKLKIRITPIIINKNWINKLLLTDLVIGLIKKNE